MDQSTIALSHVTDVDLGPGDVVPDVGPDVGAGVDVGPGVGADFRVGALMLV